MDTLATIGFIAFVLVMIYSVFSSIDLVMQRRKGVKKVNGRVPDGPTMEVCYGVMAVFVLFVMHDIGGTSSGLTDGSSIEDEGFSCTGSMRC